MPISKTCPQCGREFKVSPAAAKKYRFCGLECRRLAQKRGIRPRYVPTPEFLQNARERKLGERNPNWLGDDAKDNAKRARAIRRYELGQCERCENPAQDRHHVDGNTGNNDPSNIMRLCRRCHMEVDGRLKRFGWEIGVGR